VGGDDREARDLVGVVGAVREGVTTVDNVVTVLRSPRVGPRQLLRALPDLVDAVRAVAEVFARVDALVTWLFAPSDPARDAVARMGATAKTSLLALADALELGVASGLGARVRLELEAHASEVAARLALVGVVVELLPAAAAPHLASLDLADLVEGARGHDPIRADPQVFAGLLEAASRVSCGMPWRRAASARPPEVRKRGDRLELVFPLPPDPAHDAVARSPRPADVVATQAVLEGLARRGGHEWVREDSAVVLRV
jgi:hypothetical protein